MALLHSSSAFYRTAPKLFDSLGQLNAPLGTLNCFLDSQHVVEILLEHQVDDLIDMYPLVVVPEWRDLPETLVGRLIRYVEDGGHLLVMGARSVGPFAEALGIVPVGERVEGAVFWLDSRGSIVGHRGDRTEYKITGDAHAYGRLFPDQYDAANWLPAGVIRTLGQGLIAGVPFDFGQRYLDAATSGARNFLSDLCHELFPDPVVEVEGTGLVDVVLAEKSGALIVHLINMAGQQRDPLVDVFDEIPPIGPIRIKARYENQPKAVTLEPGGGSPRYTFEEGAVSSMNPPARNTLDDCDLVVALSGCC